MSKELPQSYHSSIAGLPPSIHDLQQTSLSKHPDVEEHEASTELAEASDEGSIDKMRGLTNRETLRGFRQKTKAKTKQLLSLGDARSVQERAGLDDDEILANIDDDPAFNPGKLVKKKRLNGAVTRDKTIGALQSLATTVIHPKKSIKAKVTRTTAGKLSQTERPYLSQRADLEFLEAHDNLSRAESSMSSRIGTSDDGQDTWTDDCRDRVKELEAHRASLLVAWTTSRHIARIRVVPKRHIQFPENQDFIEKDSEGNFKRYQWERWLGYTLIYYTQDFSTQYIDDFDELPFDIDSLRHHVERLVMASAPWQAWAMDVRSIYRWEQPLKTGKWLAIYVVLWYTEHIVGFLWGYIIWFVAKNRYFPTTVESLRESTKRALDREGTAFKFGELIDKHGRDNWLEPLVDELGPYVQLQLGDMANMLEVFANFYAWKSPRKTASTLCFFVVCLLVSIFADMGFCIKITLFIAGGAFFLCWPIASLYPRYRYLVSPFKWILWDIPTNAEWSFQYLRRQAQISREQMIERKVEEKYNGVTAENATNQYMGQMAALPRIALEGNDAEDDDGEEDWHSVNSSHSILETNDIRAFRAQWHGVVGRLIVYSNGIRFVRSLLKKEMWRISFLELAEMRKLSVSSMPRFAKMMSEQLEIKCIDESILRLEMKQGRDEAFNIIIGFSGLQWQSLQTLAEKK